MEEETSKPFELERLADLAIDYEGSGEFRFYPANVTFPVTATDGTLGDAVSSVMTGRDLAVIRIGKRARYQPEPLLRTDVARIRAVLKAQGFKRVEFQWMAAFGRFPYRE